MNTGPSNHLVFIGFHSTAERNAPESQNELVADLLRGHGFEVRAGSARPQQLVRLADQLVLLVRHARWADAVVVDAFSGRRFWTPFLVLRIARRLDVPSVLVLHGGALPEFAAAHPQRIDSTLRHASRLVAPSAYLRRAFETRGHAVQEVPNLVDLPDPGGEERHQGTGSKILWMRTFDEDYKPMLAVDALAVLAGDHPEVTLTMAGPDRGLLAAVKRHAIDRGLGDRVAFPGYLEPSAKAAALHDHAVFLNTTQVDNTPVSVLEAMSVGLPVVATEVGGMKDLLEDGRAGMLVPAGDADRLARAVARVLEDPGLRADLVRSGRAVARRYSPDSVVRSWLGVLASVGVGPEPAERDGCRELQLADLDDVVRVHREAFPESALTQLGSRVVRAYYRWQFVGPHSEPLALGVWQGGELVGYFFGGRRNRAVAGFVQHSVGTIATGVLTHPGAVRRLALPKMVAVSRAVLRPRRSTSAATPVEPMGHHEPASDAGQATAVIRSGRAFGVLSIAVSGRAKGSGAAQALMASAEVRACGIGCTYMNLTVNSDNTRAVRFYEKLGWTATGDGSGAMVKVLVNE